MNNKQKKNIMSYVWIITDIIILICSILLILEGGMANQVLAVIGLLLLVVELVLYYTGNLNKIF